MVISVKEDLLKKGPPFFKRTSWKNPSNTQTKPNHQNEQRLWKCGFWEMAFCRERDSLKFMESDKRNRSGLLLYVSNLPSTAFCAEPKVGNLLPACPWNQGETDFDPTADLIDEQCHFLSLSVLLYFLWSHFIHVCTDAKW